MIFDDENRTPDDVDSSSPEDASGAAEDTSENKESTSADKEDLPDQEGSVMDDGLREETPDDVAEALGAVYDVPIEVSAVLGTSKMRVSQLLKMGRGAVIELDRKVGEAVDVYVNNRLIARGEVVIVDDQLGITMTEIIKSERHNIQKSQ